LAQEVLLGRENTEGVKKLCNVFPVDRLAERDKIWHYEGHLCVAGHLLCWWTLVHFSGSTNCQ